jgi:hypothetical protein
MATITYAAVAAASDGINVRTAILLIAASVAAIVGGYLGYVAGKGTQKQRFAAGAILACVAFAGAYKFLDGVVTDGTVAPAAPMPHISATPGILSP